jgi:hypothetical protein
MGTSQRIILSSGDSPIHGTLPQFVVVGLVGVIERDISYGCVALS